MANVTIDRRPNFMGSSGEVQKLVESPRQLFEGENQAVAVFLNSKKPARLGLRIGEHREVIALRAFPTGYDILPAVITSGLAKVIEVTPMEPVNTA